MLHCYNSTNRSVSIIFNKCSFYNINLISIKFLIEQAQKLCFYIFYLLNKISLDINVINIIHFKSFWVIIFNNIPLQLLVARKTIKQFLKSVQFIIFLVNIDARIVDCLYFIILPLKYLNLNSLQKYLDLVMYCLYRL